MIGWIAVFVVGPVLGVTSYWHQRSGGAGTEGWVAPAVALVVVVVVGVALVVVGRWR